MKPRAGGLALRVLLVVLGALIAVFCFWGAWEMARQIPHAPQAILPVLLFAAFGCVALASGAATFVFTPPSQDQPTTMND